MGVAQLGRALAAKSVSSVEATQAFLARAKADTHGAFLVVDEDAAIAAAKAEPSVARYLEGVAIKREIYVPGRLVNLVVG